MSPELDVELCRICPKLYADRQGDMQSTLMCFGFEIGDGWFPLVRTLSERLEAEISGLPENKRHKYRAVQVKQKFGALRFYMTRSTDEMQDLIDAAEEESASVCETCGAPGKVSRGPWLMTYCPIHQAEADAARAKLT